MKFFDLKTLKKLSFDQQIEIKKGIIETNALEDIPVAYLPDVHTTEYYFVSYSHLDYVNVYCDIFELQAHGLSIWYDRGIPAGNNWKDIALKYMSPFDCKGIIFYVSEHSMISSAVVKEIDFALSMNKRFLIIFIPTNNEKSPLELAKRLLDEGTIDEERYKYYKKVFPEDILYLPYSTPVLTKIEKINNALPEKPLLNIDLLITAASINRMQTRHEEVFFLNIGGVENYYATSIEAKHYFELINNPAFKTKFIKEYYLQEMGDIGPKDVVVCLENGAFSNSKNLEYVEIPAFNGIDIEDYAFTRCERLKEIRFIDRDKNYDCFITVGVGAFSKCYALENFDFWNVEINKASFEWCISLCRADLSILANASRKIIPENAFSACSSLTEVILPDELEVIERNAFGNCSELREISFPPHLEKIGDYAFMGSVIEVIDFRNCPLKTIGNGAFIWSENKEIYLPKTLVSIGESIVSVVEKITYEGTYDELMRIVNPKWLDDIHNDLTLVCSDKTVIIPKQ